MKALECAKSYLLFHPNDLDVSENVSFYESLISNFMDPADVKPRKVSEIIVDWGSATASVSQKVTIHVYKFHPLLVVRETAIPQEM